MKLQGISMKPLILEIISRIQMDKETKKIVPSHATRQEIIRTIIQRTDKSLQELVSEGKLRTGDTINDKYFEL